MGRYIFENKIFKIRETLEKDVNKWYKWFNDPFINKFLCMVLSQTHLKNKKNLERNVIGNKN